MKNALHRARMHARTFDVVLVVGSSRDTYRIICNQPVPRVPLPGYRREACVYPARTALNYSNTPYTRTARAYDCATRASARGWATGALSSHDRVLPLGLVSSVHVRLVQLQRLF